MNPKKIDILSSSMQKMHNMAKRRRKYLMAITIGLMLIAVGCGRSADGELNLEEIPEIENVSEGELTDSTDQLAANSSEETNEDENGEEAVTIETEEEEAIAEIDAGAEQLVPSVQVKGIYVTGPIAGSERMNELIELVKETQLNAMVIDIKNDEGNLTYKMELPVEYDYDAGIRYVSDMPGLLKKLHEEDIYIIGRIVCFKDPILASSKPELALCVPDGRPVMDANGLAWVNPYQEEVWDYLCTIAEYASLDGFDEIQFDYVRFPIGEDANAADYGVDMETYPREEGLSNFFEYTQKRLHEKKIIFGADLFGTVIGSEVDRDRTGQSYPALAQMTDAICPMIYPSHYAAGTFGLAVPDANPYETITKALALSQEELTSIEKKAVVRPWLQCFNAVWVKGHITYDSVAVKEQIQAVYDAGYEEWLLWNASNHYEQVAEALAMLEKSDES